MSAAAAAVASIVFAAAPPGPDEDVCNTGLKQFFGDFLNM
jgi:hypothetical protein